MTVYDGEDVGKALVALFEKQRKIPMQDRPFLEVTLQNGTVLEALQLNFAIWLASAIIGEVKVRACFNRGNESLLYLWYSKDCPPDQRFSIDDPWVLRSIRLMD